MKSFKKFITEAKPKILERLINQLKDKGFDVGAASLTVPKLPLPISFPIL